jgi:hypothetical protein
MRTSDRNRLGPKDTIAGWRSSIYHSPILNRIWQLLPGFILWQIWKERNMRIFNSVNRTWQEVWDTIYTNIKETISLHPWVEQDLQGPQNEQHIIRAWNVNITPTSERPRAPHVRRWGALLDMTHCSFGWGDDNSATWPPPQPPGVRPRPRPYPGHLWPLRYLPPPSFLHLGIDVHSLGELCNSCAFMKPCRRSFLSLQLTPWLPLLLDMMGSLEPHFPVSITEHHFSRALPSLRPAFELWCDLLWILARLRGSLLTMPRPRGKPKRGAAWYLARGRKPPASEAQDEPVAPHAALPEAFPADPPPEALPADPTLEAIPAFPPLGAAQPLDEAPPVAPLLVPGPNQLPCDQTTCEQPPCDLSPLSNPYGCRVEWFDLYGNSLGFAPPPPSPPPRPSYPPSPPRPPLTTPHPTSPLRSSSSSSLHTHPNFSCAKCADRTKLLETINLMKKDLEVIKLMKKDLEEIKAATLDAQQRETDRWRRVDALMMFMQDLQQAMAERGKGKAPTKQVFAGLRLGPGF